MPKPFPTTRPNAFTLIELLVVVLVIVILAGILIVAFAGVRRSAQEVATQQTVSGLATAVQAFKNDFGFAPPLVKDNNRDKYPGHPTGGPFARPSPIDIAAGRVAPEAFRFSTAADNAADRDYLRRLGVSGAAWRTEPDHRFSEYSLAYYLVGALPASVDGVDGPGFNAVRRNGTFERSGQRYAPYYDVADRPDAVGLYVSPSLNIQVSENQGRYELRDANGVAFRYYRWLPGDPAAGTETRIASSNDLRVPFVVAGRSFELRGADVSYTDPRVRDAEWAIVAAGPSGTFGDLGTEGAARIIERSGVNADASNQDQVLGRAVPAAQRDNVVEVGR